MTLKEFINKYDIPESIVLLEGKRNVIDSEEIKLTQLGKLLASQTQHMKFRSGNADGSDYYFACGVEAVDKSRLQVITPYSGHRKKANNGYETFALDTIDLASESEVIDQSKSNKKMAPLVKKYVDGLRDQYSIKAAYIIRDTIKAIGTAEIKPAAFGIFYDNLENPMTGGTGHTMNVCLENGIPIVDQRVWFGWLEE